RLVAAANADEGTYPPSPHVERQIYDGFWSDADGRKLEVFHCASWDARATLADDLEDPRLVWLARRLIFVERPHLLAPEHHASMAAEKAGRLMAADCDARGWTTLAKAVSEAEGLLQEGASGTDPLQQLIAYLGAKRMEAVG